MNCKPGDLAYVMGTVPELCRPLIGRVVQVSHMVETDPVRWRLVEPLIITIAGVDWDVVGIEDMFLTPITPPAPEQLRIEDSFDPMFVALGIQSRTYA